jgi:hypothetical protein
MKKPRSSRRSRPASAARAERQEVAASELEAAELGDRRRQQRLQTIVRDLAAKPATPFPRALATEGDLEGFYRFVRNEAVTFERLLAPHVMATVARMADHPQVLAVHDTTEFRFGGTREGLGRLSESGHGFLGHFTLAVAANDARTVLGALAVEAWSRTKPTISQLRKQGLITYGESAAMPNEQDRWLRGVEAAEAAVGDRANVLHVMDSEADDYGLMGKLGTGRRWIIRLGYNRALATEEPTKVRELVAKRRVRCRRNVHLSRRRRYPGGHGKRTQVRKERDAELAITATRTVFRRPYYCRDVPDTLPVNIVSVRELHPPPDDEPIEWLLITTEPIETVEQILHVVDCYRCRWVIEEYFKALKTGCAIEKRQLESRHTLLNALAIMMPIAWSLLRLRTVARDDGDAPSRVVPTELEEKVLRKASKTPLPVRPSARDAMLAVARLGGHLRSNGDPGWQVLGRGYQDLLMMVAGYRLAMHERSDQS